MSSGGRHHKCPVQHQEGAGTTDRYHQQEVFENLAGPVGGVGKPEIAEPRMQVKGHLFHLLVGIGVGIDIGVGGKGDVEIVVVVEIVDVVGGTYGIVHVP